MMTITYLFKISEQTISLRCSSWRQNRLYKKLFFLFYGPTIVEKKV